jgi:nitrate/nitrite transporter NarK
MPKPEALPPKRKPRWGVYTLCFLALAFVMVVISTTQKHYTLLTLLGLIVGFGGAGWCTIKGLKVAREFRLPGR